MRSRGCFYSWSGVDVGKRFLKFEPTNGFVNVYGLESFIVLRKSLRASQALRISAIIPNECKLKGANNGTSKSKEA